MIRILHIESGSYRPEDLESLAAVGTVQTAEVRSTEELLAALAGAQAEALFIGLGVLIDDRVIDASPSLRWVVSPTTGLDHIDVPAMERAGVAVISLRDAPERIATVHATAELTWGLLLAVVRRIPAAHAAVVSGQWDRSGYLGRELNGRTLGVVGHGRLGEMVANYGRAFGMRVVAHDSDPMALAGLPASEVVAPSDLIAQSDVLSLHLKLNESSAGWLSAERISLLPPGAVVVNTARGGLVDEEALAAAVRSGRLSGVGVDVLTLETDRSGRIQESPLIDAATAGYNVVVTPHIGGYAVDAIGLTRGLAVELFLERLGRQRNDHGMNQPGTGSPDDLEP